MRTCRATHPLGMQLEGQEHRCEQAEHHTMHFEPTQHRCACGFRWEDSALSQETDHDS